MDIVEAWKNNLITKKSLKLSERTQVSRPDIEGAISELDKTVQCVILNQ